MKSKRSSGPARGLVPLALVLLIIASSAFGQISVVVAKNSTQTVAKDQVKNVYSGATVTWADGKKIQVVDQADTEIGKAFYDNVVGKPVAQVRVQWTKLVLSGQAVAPKKLADDNAVKAAVAGDPNAIGYISSGALDGTVKEIARF